MGSETVASSNKPLVVMTIVGARPQFIKAAVVSRALRSTSGVREVLLHTGQHYDDNMSDVFFREMGIPAPDYSLGIGSGTHGAQTGQMLEAIEKVLLDVKPDWTVVYGDTNSTLAGALAAAKLHVPTAHVEAGLRSFNRRMPEEINRVLTDHASDLLFAPTPAAVGNLKREGVPESRVLLTGDVMYDAALYYGARAEKESHVLSDLGLERKGYVLATIHRAESTDDPDRLNAIFEGLSSISRDMTVVLPVHPRTRAAAQRERLLGRVGPGVTIVDPVGYIDMIMLERSARLVVTDSGGVQKEAFFCRVPCVTLRNETEWVELVELGWNRLVPADSAESVRAGILDALERPVPERTCGAQPYGDGDAAGTIVHALVERRCVA